MHVYNETIDIQLLYKLTRPVNYKVGAACVHCGPEYFASCYNTNTNPLFCNSVVHVMYSNVSGQCVRAIHISLKDTKTIIIHDLQTYHCSAPSHYEPFLLNQ